MFSAWLRFLPFYWIDSLENRIRINSFKISLYRTWIDFHKNQTAIASLIEICNKYEIILHYILFYANSQLITTHDAMFGRNGLKTLGENSGKNTGQSIAF